MDFPNTRWSIVLQLRSSSDSHRHRAFEELCQHYWKPLYTFARRGGRTIHDAEDLTQGFLTHLLSADNLTALSPDKGRLRSYLRTAFSNFMADETRRGLRQKRGGSKLEWLDLDAAERQTQRELKESRSPEEAFDRHWGHIVLKRALQQLRENFATRGRGETLQALQVFLGPDDLAPSYREMAEQLGQSENTIAAAVSRMRREFRDLLREEIADTLADGEDVDEELRYLLRVAS